MSDFLDARLAALRDGPVPPLAPAERIRGRGEQRRRRMRAAAGGAGLALVIGLAGAGYTLSSSEPGDGALQYAPAPSPEPSVQPSAEPSSTPSVSPSPAAVPGVSGALLLQPSDAERITGQEWTGVHSADARPRLQVCPEPLRGVEAGREGVLQRGAETESVAQQILRFDRPARAVLDELRADVPRCPSRPSEGGTVSHELLPGPAGAVALRATYSECATCRGIDRFWVAVAHDRLVNYISLDAKQESALGAWARAAAERLACGSGCRSAQPDELGPEPGPLDADDKVRIDGIGPVVVGMTLEEAETAAGQPFTAFEDELGNGCGFVGPRSRQPDITLMVVRGIVIRVDSPGAVQTDRGVGAGSTEEEVRRAYGSRVRTRPHDYTAGNYLEVPSSDGRYVLVFETDGKQVVSFRTGTPEAARYNEGCA